MTLSSRLGLSYLLPNQAQKHVVLNESLRRLDVLVQLTAESRSLSTPPLAPEPGQVWIVADEASDAWAGRAGQIACWQDDAWALFSPKSGWMACVLEEAALHVWTGTEWLGVTSAEGGPLQNLSLLGVGTEVDTENPFSAKLNKALWTARGVSEVGDGNLRYIQQPGLPARRTGRRQRPHCLFFESAGGLCVREEANSRMFFKAGS